MNIRKFIYYYFLILPLFFASCKDSKPDPFDYFVENGSPLFQELMSQKEKYDIQVLFSPVVNSSDSLVLDQHMFHLRPGEYFYPASTVKLPVVLLALEKLNFIRKHDIDIDRNTAMLFDSLQPWQHPHLVDTTTAHGSPSIAGLIERVFATSDNAAFNRLVDFVGLDQINAYLKNKDVFTNSRITHRLGTEAAGLDQEQNRHSPPISFIEDKDTLFQQLAFRSQSDYIAIVDKQTKGKAYVNRDGQLVEEPFSFENKNHFNLLDMQSCMERVMFPQFFGEFSGFDIAESDWHWLHETMAKVPREFTHLRTHGPNDGYIKFFMFGGSDKQIPKHITIRNKVGIAYGFVSDCAFIEDTKHDVSCFLFATIYVNENETINDDTYEYETVGIPFLAELGNLAHQYMITYYGH